MRSNCCGFETVPGQFGDGPTKVWNNTCSLQEELISILPYVALLKFWAPDVPEEGVGRSLGANYMDYCIILDVYTDYIVYLELSWMYIHFSGSLENMRSLKIFGLQPFCLDELNVR